MLEYSVDRRRFLRNGSTILAAASMVVTPSKLWAQGLANVEVASAGSLRAMLEGPIKAAASKSLKLGIQAHSGGADTVAASIVRGELKADVFIPITASPMQTVMKAGKTRSAFPIARTELVLVFSPKSRFASQLEAAANGRANWWEVLQQPGLRIGRGNPAADPGARAIIFAMMLAAQKYNQKDLVQKILGTPLNQDQIVTGVQDRLASGELDVSASYKIGVQGSQLPFITLPDEVNLSRDDLRVLHPDISLMLDGKMFYPEPLIFYAASLTSSANPAVAASFVEWLQGSEAQALFRENWFNPPGKASTLRA